MLILSTYGVKLHGYSTPTNTADFTLRASGEPANDKITLSRLRLYYERPLKAHAIRDWLSSHPRLVLPAVAFLVGTLSYTVSKHPIAVPNNLIDTLVLRSHPSLLCEVKVGGCVGYRELFHGERSVRPYPILHKDCIGFDASSYPATHTSA